MNEERLEAPVLQQVYRSAMPITDAVIDRIAATLTARHLDFVL